MKLITEWPTDEKELPVYFTPLQMASLRKVSLRTLARERLAGTGPAFVRIGRQTAYRRDALLDWLKRMEVTKEPG